MRTTSITRQNWLWFLVAIFMVSMVAPDLSFGGKGNETVLVANFINGNNPLFLGRIYLFNASKKDGNVTVRVFTLPNLGGGPRAELTTTPIDLGSLGAKEGLNIKLETDILPNVRPVLPLPYTDDGGNLVLEFKVGTKNVTGLAQYFNGITFEFFDSYPLQVVPN